MSKTYDLPEVRLVIFVEGGVVQDTYSPDVDENIRFNIIIKDIDEGEVGEKVVRRFSDPSVITDKEWEKYCREADADIEEVK